MPRYAGGASHKSTSGMIRPRRSRKRDSRLTLIVGNAVARKNDRAEPDVCSPLSDRRDRHASSSTAGKSLESYRNAGALSPLRREIVRSPSRQPQSSNVLSNSARRSPDETRPITPRAQWFEPGGSLSRATKPEHRNRGQEININHHEEAVHSISFRRTLARRGFEEPPSSVDLLSTPSAPPLLNVQRAYSPPFTRD